MSLRRMLTRLRFSRYFRYIVALVLLSFGLYILNSDKQKSPQKRPRLKFEAVSNYPNGEVEDDVQTIFTEGVLGNYEPSPPEQSRSGPGENGAAVNTDDETKRVRQQTAEFGFNVVASDAISLNRTIPDTRLDECKHWHYPAKLPTATVAIVFHNEAWTPLMRTVHSVILRSPKELLVEVLLVDDFSSKTHLDSLLEKYIAQFNGLIRLIRNEKREGLIRSRSRAGAEAKGDVVVFLDAHCEANTNWLPPLLAPIAENHQTMTVPVIDSIDMNTWRYHSQWGYTGDVLHRGIFEWGLLYKEQQIPDHEQKRRKHKSEPFRSPTHAGGLFAIDRSWFAQLGFYDDGLQIWGGENFELSFKVWQCGGSILFVPCSRVGHVYRNFMPYNFGSLKGPIVSLNYKRVAEVWMDEYKQYYYNREPFMRNHEISSVDDMLAIKEGLRCQSFDWYMKNVAPEVLDEYPVQPNLVVWGEAVNVDKKKCIDTLGKSIPNIIGVSGCHHQGGNQLYRINEKGQMATGEWCIENTGTQLTTARCEGKVSGHFSYDKTTKQIHHTGKGLCVQVVGDTNLGLAKCRDNDGKQQWTFNELYQ